MGNGYCRLTLRSCNPVRPIRARFAEPANCFKRAAAWQSRLPARSAARRTFSAPRPRPSPSWSKPSSGCASSTASAGSKCRCSKRPRCSPLARRDDRRGLEGDVLVRGSRRRIADPAARVHRRDRPRLPDRRLAAARPAQGRDARPAVPLRAPAKGPLSPVPPARRRDHRRGRAAGRCRAAGDGRPAAQGAGHCRRA